MLTRPHFEHLEEFYEKADGDDRSVTENDQVRFITMRLDSVEEIPKSIKE